MVQVDIRNFSHAERVQFQTRFQTKLSQELWSSFFAWSFVKFVRSFYNFKQRRNNRGSAPLIVGKEGNGGKGEVTSWGVVARLKHRLQQQRQGKRAQRAVGGKGLQLAPSSLDRRMEAGSGPSIDSILDMQGLDWLNWFLAVTPFFPCLSPVNGSTDRLWLSSNKLLCTVMLHSWICLSLRFPFPSPFIGSSRHAISISVLDLFRASRGHMLPEHGKGRVPIRYDTIRYDTIYDT